MKSHEYDFDFKDLLRLAGLPLLGLCAFALLCRLGVVSGLLPTPRPTLDADRTILAHQAESSRRKTDADVVLIGDSSCLMDVSAKQLNQMFRPGHSTLNLGTLSYLDLDSYAAILGHFVSANPGRLRAVVLLMHPEALRRPAPSQYHVETLDHIYAGTDYCGPGSSPAGCLFGTEIFKGRLLTRIMPQPLSGALGRYYGFTWDLWNYLSLHDGSALDPGQFNLAQAQGNAEYRLARSLEETSRRFRSTVPGDAKLLVGITPAPEGFAGSQFASVQVQLLQTWNQWLQADVVLSSLPAVLPDALFAGTTHLNERGAYIYTQQLGRILAEQLARAEPVHRNPAQPSPPVQDENRGAVTRP